MGVFGEEARSSAGIHSKDFSISKDNNDGGKLIVLSDQLLEIFRDLKVTFVIDLFKHMDLFHS